MVFQSNSPTTGRGFSADARQMGGGEMTDEEIKEALADLRKVFELEAKLAELNKKLNTELNTK